MAGRMTLSLLLLICWACAGSRGLDRLRGLTTTLSPSEESTPQEMELRECHRDTLSVTDADGKEIHIMRAVKEIDGEMVATDLLSAARVTAKFRNVAERNGHINLRFDICVPPELHDSRRQLRLQPFMDILGDRIPLEPVFLTGTAYRRTQLRGYEQYRRFLDSIISDSTLLTDRRQLELFIRRNIPELYRFRHDTSRVSDEAFASSYGVTQRQAGLHYALRYKIRRNNRKIAMRERMFARYVKAPIRTDGPRLDTVMAAADEAFLYPYVQTVRTRPGLRKIDVTIGGEIYEQDRCLLRLPPADTLTFYVSSLSSFAEPVEKYKSFVVERKAGVHTACYIEFSPGVAAIDPGLGENSDELARIRSNIRQLSADKTFAMDSIVVTVSFSPEGSDSANKQLSRLRAEALSRHFKEELFPSTDTVRFIARNCSGSWEKLDGLVRQDTLLSTSDKNTYFIVRQISDADRREAALQKEPFYRYLREKLYPRLRIVQFDFHLHRHGMIQDTVHMIQPDTVYRNGIRALQEREYEKAVTLLLPYRDQNTAVALLCLGYNDSAREIIEGLDPTGPVEYLNAILHARAGDGDKAVEAYLRACRLNPVYIHRGQLDPEIAGLIRDYGLYLHSDPSF